MSTADHPAGLHALVETYSRALHHYVDVAVGVRGESGDPAEAGVDPRLEVAAREAALAMGRLEDACTSSLGLTAAVGMAWSEEDSPVTLGEASPVRVVDGERAGATDADGLVADAFHLHFAVLAAPGSSDEALDGVLEIVEDAGYDVVTRLEEAGYEVPEFGLSRGDPEPFDFLRDTGDGDDGGAGDEPGDDR